MPLNPKVNRQHHGDNGYGAQHQNRKENPDDHRDLGYQKGSAPLCNTTRCVVPGPNWNWVYRFGDSQCGFMVTRVWTVRLSILLCDKRAKEKPRPEPRLGSYSTRVRTFRAIRCPAA